MCLEKCTRCRSLLHSNFKSQDKLLSSSLLTFKLLEVDGSPHQSGSCLGAWFLADSLEGGGGKHTLFDARKLSVVRVFVARDEGLNGASAMAQ
jgi:hypothetical protein